MIFSCNCSVGFIQIECVPLYAAECRGHVRLPVHEALHGRGDLPASPPQFLPPPPQQLLWPLGPVSPPRGLVAWAESVWHLKWSLAPDEHQLPCSPQMPRLWPGLLFTLLSHHDGGLLRESKRSTNDHKGSQGVRTQFSFKKRYNLYI